MDPNIALIVGALAAGAAQAARNIAPDAYYGLKRLILHRFSGNNKVQNSLEGLEDQDAETVEAYRVLLGKALAEVNAGDDTEILAAAEQLEKELQQDGDTINLTGTQSGGKDNVQQNIGNMTGGTVIGRQDKDTDQ